MDGKDTHFCRHRGGFFEKNTVARRLPVASCVPSKGCSAMSSTKSSQRATDHSRADCKFFRKKAEKRAKIAGFLPVDFQWFICILFFPSSSLVGDGLDSPRQRGEIGALVADHRLWIGGEQGPLLQHRMHRELQAHPRAHRLRRRPPRAQPRRHTPEGNRPRGRASAGLPRA